jgi:hypothetical protein
MSQATMDDVWSATTTHRLALAGDGVYIPGGVRACFDEADQTVVIVRRPIGHSKSRKERIGITNTWRDIDGTGVQIRRSDDIDSIDVRRRQRRP